MREGTDTLSSYIIQYNSKNNYIDIYVCHTVWLLSQGNFKFFINIFFGLNIKFF